MIDTMTSQLGMPLQVLRKAHELGIHNDCLAAGADRECSKCTSVVIRSFDAFYGHLETDGERLKAIVDDMLADGDHS